ncbi:hypothetical protein P154DRAFT_146441 [Amniculicola lignicola CBS 123094]|uniref:DUF2415 domain-containing protein n=1 Tax=Amniculicola lignicola CBS 123094 TaxID=1392246 RepID=A0A6A5WN93_9PLEO|nr:hypothetical protein P154DRAFT_146441 [Amniculicola lignicola CBS 123094]
MAVDDFIQSRDTDAFVLPSRSYYPLKIPIAHYQLRHFINSPEQDLVYYASGADVYCLNASTKTQAHVATLPWEARCTAAGHGYVCVGGAEDGNFAAIKVAGFPPTDPSDVDALLPLDFTTRTPLPRPPLLGTAHRIRLEKIGEDIVNSISIHKFPAEGDGADEVVAVLTNNDKTVRVFSLTQHLELTVLDLPFPMNHATISPDGQMLVAVGDQQQGYFFERVKTQKPSTMKTPEGRMQSIPPEWALFEEVRLYVPPDSSIEGYFTTAWSPSGSLCALGSECGYITVFDVEELKRCEYGEDAIVQLISSSKPDVLIGPGAVRTMLFSPAPWDFLIWSEDQARVCIADLRSGLKVKQVLELDSKDESFERIQIADFDLDLTPELRDLRREADFIRRYRRALDSEGTAAAVNFATDYIEASSERRRLHRQSGVVESDNDPHGLTAHEREILSTLGTIRHVPHETRDVAMTPRSINYTSAARRIRDLSEYRHLEEAIRDLGSDTARVTSQLGERTSPRRQPSIVVQPSSSSVGEATVSITGSAPTRSPGTIPPHARRVDPQIISATDDAWRTIEDALARNPRTTTTVNLNSSTTPELRTELRRLRQLTQMRERLRTAREAAPSDPYSLSGMGATYRRASRSLHHDPSNGVRTAGLAMSLDGRTLYCGTEEGIFEFQINMQERRGAPAIVPR